MPRLGHSPESVVPHLLGLRFTYARAYVVVALRLADDLLWRFRLGLFVFGVHRMAHLGVVVASLPEGASTVWHCL